MVASRPLEGEHGHWTGPLKPLAKWRLPLDNLRARPDVGAIFNTYATVAIARKPIAACHDMIAAFGGDDIRCAGCARYATRELSDLALAAPEAATAV